MKALILSILLACSCTKYSPVIKDAVGLKVSEIEMPITHLKEVTWLIGKPKEAYVTQSITFMVNMPRVREEDLDHINQLKGIDSWIVRLIVQRGSESQDLGSLYARFKPRSVLRGQTGGAPTSVSIKIYYAAAYASERFRSFSCPAFSHTSRITEMKIQGESKEFDITIDQISDYAEKSHLVELTPSAFNAGNSLVGEYFIEIAPYDSEKKVIHAAFKRIPMSVEVMSEKRETVKSCLGEHPEIRQ